MYNYLGLIVEFLFFLGGIYLYMFATGRVTFSNFEAEAKAKKIRKENGTALRILSLGVIAVMFLNLLLNFKELFGY